MKAEDDFFFSIAHDEEVTSSQDDGECEKHRADRDRTAPVAHLRRGREALAKEFIAKLYSFIL